MPAFDPVAFIEVCYALDEPHRRWLSLLADAARTALGVANVGAYALTYDASDVDDCRFGRLAPSGIESKEAERVLRVEMPRAFRAEPAIVEAVFRRIPYGPSDRLPLAGKTAASRVKLARLGAPDILGLNGINVDGRGLHVGILRPRVGMRTLAPNALARLSTHLAAAFRLRARLEGKAALDAAEAVVAANGARTILHATGAAKLREARRELADAAARIERLRGAARSRDPERAVAQWRALVDARWSLVDYFDRDGRRFLLAQRNDASVAPFALLTARERQVVALAAVGHANKMIGYELGISVSTVGVLLSRAARKLGVSSRAALVAAYERHARLLVRKQRGA